MMAHSLPVQIIGCALMLTATSVLAEECDRDLSGFCPHDQGVAAITGNAEITDGDTIEIGPVQIRLHGIDAPESGQTCKTESGGTWRCGERATARLAELADGKPVRCLGKERDKYDRIIAVCTSGDVQLNARMVSDGLAWAFVEYSRDYAVLEQAARSTQTGIWQAESEPPWEYRDNRWQRAAADAPQQGCPIKGNINRKGERIYHPPWSPAYPRTVIDESAGERWFCDEAEAKAVGWRPPRWY